MEEGLKHMDKEKWKKIINTITDSSLASLTAVWGLKINGYRQITEKNIKKARKPIIVEALKGKNLADIIEFYDTMATADYSESEILPNNIRERSVEDLLKLHEEGLELHIILGCLHASDEEIHHELANNFETKLKDNYDVNSIEEVEKHQEESAPTIQEVETTSNKELSKLQKKFDKTVAKTEEFKKKIQELEKKNTNLKAKHKEEKQAWIKEKALLQQEIGNDKATVKKELEQLNTLKEENEKLKQKIDEVKAENNHLHAKLLKVNSDKISGSSQTNDNSTSNNKLQILLIGDPKNRIFDNDTERSFDICSPNEALDVMECGEKSSAYDEVWFLDYLVSPFTKKKIKKCCHNEMKEFKDFTQVKAYLEKGKR